MRTWRWLGVNEAKVEEALLMDTEEKIITVPEGSKNSLVVVYRKESHGHIKIRLDEGAELSLTRVQLLPDDAQHAGSVEAVVAAGARLHYTAIEAGASSSVTKLSIDLQDDDSEADVAALYLGDGQRRIDMNYVIRQQGKNTRADMQVRGALLGESQKIIRGTLDFQHGSKGSQGHENEEVVLLSPKVRNRSVPLMLSGEDDVDGHHAVSVGKMDENKLFYLMSRGLDLAEARRLVVEAAFSPVLERVPEQALREEIDAYIEGRLSHD